MHVVTGNWEKGAFPPYFIKVDDDGDDDDGDDVSSPFISLEGSPLKAKSTRAHKTNGVGRLTISSVIAKVARILMWDQNDQSKS